MAKGMNWGIFSLLGVVVVVLGGIAAFFVHLAKRSAALAAQPVGPNPGRASVTASPDSLGFDGQVGLSGRFAFPDGAAPPLEPTDLGV